MWKRFLEIAIFSHKIQFLNLGIFRKEYVLIDSVEKHCLSFNLSDFLLLKRSFNVYYKTFAIFWKVVAHMGFS